MAEFNFNLTNINSDTELNNFPGIYNSNNESLKSILEELHSEIDAIKQNQEEIKRYINILIKSISTETKNLEGDVNKHIDEYNSTINLIDERLKVLEK